MTLFRAARQSGKTLSLSREFREFLKHHGVLLQEDMMRASRMTPEDLSNCRTLAEEVSRRGYTAAGEVMLMLIKEVEALSSFEGYETCASFGGSPRPGKCELPGCCHEVYCLLHSGRCESLF